MCLQKESLARFRQRDDYSGLTDEEFNKANEIFVTAWPHLDHTRRYCINHDFLVQQLLLHTGRECTLKFSPIKQEEQRKLIQYIYQVYKDFTGAETSA